jgi:hypothetical protein
MSASAFFTFWAVVVATTMVSLTGSLLAMRY